MLNYRKSRVERRQFGDVTQHFARSDGFVVHAVYRDLAFILKETDDRLDDRTLSGSVGSEKDRKRSGLKCKGNVVACKVFAVTLCYVFDFQHISNLPIIQKLYKFAIWRPFLQEKPTFGLLKGKGLPLSGSSPKVQLLEDENIMQLLCF